MKFVKKRIKRRLIQALPGNKPDFLIVGAQKSGTTSLHHYLNRHPLLVGSRPKEIHFFDKYINYPQRDIRWYENHFKVVNWRRSKFLHFESSPNYIYHEEAAKNIQRFYPKMKLILVLRNPVPRAFSAWQMYRGFFLRNEGGDRLKDGLRPGDPNLVYKHLFEGRSSFPSFRECIDIELNLIKGETDYEPSILRRGLYYDQIQTYLRYFNPEQLLIIGFNELIKQPSHALNKILHFLGLEGGGDWTNLTFGNLNKSENKSIMLDQDRILLEGYYQDSTSRLVKYFNRELDW